MTNGYVCWMSTTGNSPNARLARQMPRRRGLFERGPYCHHCLPCQVSLYFHAASLLMIIVLSGPCHITEREKSGKTHWEDSKVASCTLNRSLKLSPTNDDITSQASDTETGKCIKWSIPGKASSGSVDLPARASRRGSQNELEVQRHHH